MTPPITHAEPVTPPPATAPSAAAPPRPVAPSASVTPATWRDFLTLTKPEISFLVALSTLAGFMLGSGPEIAGWTLFFAVVGTLLTSAGVGALNHCLEVEHDRTMKRTARRPLPDGRISVRTAYRFGVFLVAVGIGILCPLTNPLTATLAILTVVLYLYVYTPLKRVTTYNTLVGTIPGALPALGGWTAATGTLGAGGWALFAVLVCWQMPHFLSLAWMYRKDYDRGGYQMLTVTDPEGTNTVRQTLGFTILLLGASLLPTWLGLSSLGYAVVAGILGLWFLRSVVTFYQSRSVQDARRVLKASVLYIPALVIAITLDRLFL